MSSRLMCLLLVLTGSAFGTTLTNNLTFALTFSRQSDVTTNNSTVTEKVEVTRIATKDLIADLGIVTTNIFPHGSTLALAFVSNSPVVLVLGKEQIFLADVSQFFGFTFATNTIHKGKLNLASGASTETTYTTATVSFNDGVGNSFDLAGIMTEQSKEHNQKESSAVVVDGSGPGTSGGRFCVVKGRARWNGKGDVTVSP